MSLQKLPSSSIEMPLLEPALGLEQPEGQRLERAVERIGAVDERAPIGIDAEAAR